MTVEELCISVRQNLPPLFECSAAPLDSMRVRTPLLYPDGGLVDVFVLERDSGYQVTDYGETLAWLSTQTASGRRSNKQRGLVDDVCQTLGVELHRGQLRLRSHTLDGLGETVLRLAQAAVRVSDVWFTFRNRVVESTAEEVDEWLEERNIPFERSVRQQGRSGREWTIDFQTTTPLRTSHIFLLSTGSRGAVRRITEHVFTGCSDLNILRESQPQSMLISLFDDVEDVWREEDFVLLEPVSEVARWSRPDLLELTLNPA